MVTASIVSSATDAVTSAIGDYGLYAVFVLMFIDAVFPAASEVVMVYGGAVASGAFAGQDVVFLGRTIEEGLPAYLAIALAGTIGYTLGAICGWAVGLYGGRPYLERHGRWLHVDDEKLGRAERWFERWEDWAVFLGRLTPVITVLRLDPRGCSRDAVRPLHAPDARGLGDLVLHVRGRRVRRGGELGGLEPRVPLLRLPRGRHRGRGGRVARCPPGSTSPSHQGVDLRVRKSEARGPWVHSPT